MSILLYHCATYWKTALFLNFLYITSPMCFKSLDGDLSHARNGILRFTSGVTPANLKASMITEFFLDIWSKSSTCFQLDIFRSNYWRGGHLVDGPSKIWTDLNRFDMNFFQNTVFFCRFKTKISFLYDCGIEIVHQISFYCCILPYIHSIILCHHRMFAKSPYC